MTAINIQMITWSLMWGVLLHESGGAELTWLMGLMGSVLIVLLMPAISVKPVFVLHIQASILVLTDINYKEAPIWPTQHTYHYISRLKQDRIQ